MRKVFCLLILFPILFVNAQESSFLRVYNGKGKKINKGYLFYLSDSSITLTRKKDIVKETDVSEINLIKSKRTTGHRILITTATIVTVAGLVVIVLNANKHGTKPA